MYWKTFVTIANQFRVTAAIYLLWEVFQEAQISLSA
jgi:hypothetical protein